MAPEKFSMSFNLTAMPKAAAPMEVTTLVMATGSPCEVACQVRKCGTDLCPRVASIKGAVDSSSGSSGIAEFALQNSALKERGLRISSESTSTPRESHVSGAAGGGGETQIDCKDCNERHGSSYSCSSQSKKKAA